MAQADKPINTYRRVALKPSEQQIVVLTPEGLALVDAETALGAPPIDEIGGLQDALDAQTQTIEELRSMVQTQAQQISALTEAIQAGGGAVGGAIPPIQTDDPNPKIPVGVPAGTVLLGLSTVPPNAFRSSSSLDNRVVLDPNNLQIKRSGIGTIHLGDVISITITDTPVDITLGIQTKVISFTAFISADSTVLLDDLSITADTGLPGAQASATADSVAVTADSSNNKVDTF